MKPASQRAGRRLWSNVELFEVWPQNCTGTWAHCTGRHPAPIERIIKQMANEAPLVETLIAWEWHSCLSPNAEDLSYGGVIKQRYEEYLLRGIYMASRSFKLPLFLHPFMAYLLTGAGILKRIVDKGDTDRLSTSSTKVEALLESVATLVAAEPGTKVSLSTVA